MLRRPEKDLGLLAQAEMNGVGFAARLEYERLCNSTPILCSPAERDAILSAEAKLREAITPSRTARGEAGAWTSSTPSIDRGAKPPWVA